MAIVTTYVCDVSGKNGTEKFDFVTIEIIASENRLVRGYHAVEKVKVNKLVHKDIAAKLNLLAIEGDVKEQPEVTFESKLAILLKDYVEEIAYEAGAEAASNYNRGG